MDSDPADRSPRAASGPWELSRTARAKLIHMLAVFDADYEEAFALGEYRLATMFAWERERIRLILHPPLAATDCTPAKRLRRQ